MSMNYFLLLAALAFQCIAANRFHAHDKVDLVANTVGPYNNPTETYPVSSCGLVILKMFHALHFVAYNFSL